MPPTDRFATPLQPPFLDFEASSLNINSYPIQVAWSLPDDAIQCHFINPDSIDEWTDWDSYAETKIHQIPRQTLTREGLHPRDVAEAMNAALEDQIVYVDGGMYDQMWLEELFAGAELKPLFTLGDLHGLLALEAPVSFGRLDDLGQHLLIHTLRQRALAELGLRSHRADSDVRVHQRVYELVMEMERQS